MSTDDTIRRKSGYHHGDLRAQLVEATRHLVEEKGADHVSVSAACRVAGVSTAAPYRHFRDRDEMLAAVAVEGMKRQYAQMVAAIEGLPPGSLERIQALGRVYVTFARTEPGVFRLSFGMKHDLDTLEMQPGGDVTPFDLVRREVAAVIGRPEVDDEATRRAFLLWTFVHGLSFLLIDDKVAVAGMPIDVDRLIEETTRRILTD